MTIPRVLIIAGSDSGGGAGIQADIKTVTMLGGHALTAITAITAQNTQSVQTVHAVPTAMVIAQIDSVTADIGVDAIKIGMIGGADTLNAVADRLAADDLAAIPLVFDPVMVATSGSALADEDTIAAFARLMRRAAVTTPNLPELAALGGIEAVLATGSACLEKGGHANDDDGAMLIDRLYPNDPGQPPVIEWSAPRISTSSTHGTGCTLASAIAVGLAQAMPLSAAVARARDFVRLSLLNAPDLGAGHGPMGQGGVRNEALLGGPVLNQVTVPARDYAASLAFYRLLGLTLIVDSPDNGYARFEAANGVTFSVHVADEHVEPGATIYLELAALDVWHAWLLRQGVRFEQPPRDQDWGWREAHLLDPAGNRLCLYQAGEYRRFPPWRL
jgi:hydroxymethylpyrimidine/phosphomethylpyrimidine kinase